MGSKSQIAEKIIAFLPSGKRFVDLFGGGGAMSHCASLSGKYEQVLYNELNPIIAKLFSDAINGKYSKENFHPRWISREEFNAKKDVDGYIATCWSFGGNNKAYLFPIWFSNYEISDSRFECVWQTGKRSLLSSCSRELKTEKIYANAKAFEISKNLKINQQLELAI